MIEKLKNNFKLKVVVFVFSFLMWLYVMAEVDPILIKTYSSVPVNIQNMSELERENLVISPEEDLNISIILRGRRSIISNVDKESLIPYGRINDPSLGNNIINLNIDRLPSVEYTMLPDKLGIELEENELVRKEIALKRVGKLKEDYKIIDTSLNPSYTWVSGPKSLMKKVYRLEAKYNVDGKTSNFNTKLNIVAVDKEGNQIEGVDIKDKSTYLNVIVSKYKKVMIEPVIVGNLKDTLKLKGYTILNEDVEISGLEEDIDKIESIKTMPIDISLIENAGIQSLQLDIPEKISTSFKDVKVDFNILKLKSKELIISKERIKFENNIQNLDISKNNLPDEIKIKINYFEESETEKINAGNTQIFVNMQDYNKELATVPISVSSSYNYQSIEIEPKNVAITGVE